MASSLFNPWQKAGESFIEGLSPEEKIAFKSITIQQVLQDAKAIQKISPGNSRVWYLSKQLKPIVEAIYQYGQSFDNLSSVDLEILCPLWGGLKIVVHLATTFGVYYDKLLDILERIGSAIPKFNQYSKIFPSHPYLIAALSPVYLDLLSFCCHAKDIFLEGRRLRPKRSTYFSSNPVTILEPLWKPFESHFNNIVNQFHEYKLQFDREAGLSDMLEESDDELEGQQEQSILAEKQKIVDKERRKRKRWNRIISHISPCDHERIIRKLRSQVSNGSCDWVSIVPEYRGWSESTTTSILWLYGKSGIGKSALASHINDTIDGRYGPSYREISLTFFCDYTDSQSLISENVLWSLIRQMILNLGIHSTPESILATLDDMVNRHKSVDFQDLGLLFFKIIRIFRKVTIIIDGIDECDEYHREKLFRWVEVCGAFDIVPLRVLVVSSEDPSCRLGGKNQFKIDVSASRGFGNFSVTVRGLVEKMMKEKKLRIRDKVLVDTLIERLTEKANGSLLWVSLQLQNLSSYNIDELIKEALDHLPATHEETYDRILQQVVADKNGSKTAKRVYSWVYHATRPLSIDELMEVISVEDRDREIRKDRPTVDRQTLLKQCGNLIQYNEETQTITFIHQTVKSFLKQKSASDSSPPATFSKAILRAKDSYIPKTILTYLSFTNFENVRTIDKEAGIDLAIQLLTKQYDSRPNSPTNPDKGFIADVGSFIKAWSLWSAPRDSIVRQNLEYTRYLPQKKSPSTELARDFRFFSYAVSTWLHHCKVIKFWAETAEAIDLKIAFETVCFEKQFNFDIKPWGSRYSKGSQLYMDAFVWALENGHALLVQMILEKVSKDVDYYLNVRFDDQSTPFHLAARCHNDQILRSLFEASNSAAVHFLKTEDTHGRRPTHIAAINGNFEGIRTMMTYSQHNDLFARDGFHNSVVDYVIQSNELLTLQWLLPMVDINLERFGNYIFTQICKSRNTNLWKLLIQTSTFASAFDHWNGLISACKSVNENYKFVHKLREHIQDSFQKNNKTFGEDFLKSKDPSTLLEILKSWNNLTESRKFVDKHLLSVEDIEKEFSDICEDKIEDLGYLQFLICLMEERPPYPTPLLKAIEMGRKDYIQAILNAGANPDELYTEELEKGHITESSIHLAVRNGDLDILAILLAANASINLQDRNGNTAIDEAFKLLSNETTNIYNNQAAKAEKTVKVLYAIIQHIRNKDMSTTRRSSRLGPIENFDEILLSMATHFWKLHCLSFRGCYPNDYRADMILPSSTDEILLRLPNHSLQKLLLIAESLLIGQVLSRNDPIMIDKLVDIYIETNIQIPTPRVMSDILLINHHLLLKTKKTPSLSNYDYFFSKILNEINLPNDLIHQQSLTTSIRSNSLKFTEVLIDSGVKIDIFVQDELLLNVIKMIKKDTQPLSDICKMVGFICKGVWRWRRGDFPNGTEVEKYLMGMEGKEYISKEYVMKVLDNYKVYY